MRMYDRIKGRRFDIPHPVWQTHMINKGNKQVKTRMDTKLAKELEAQGLIDLRPSVTEIASVADAFGAFAAGKYWSASEAVSLYEDIITEGASTDASSFKVMLADRLDEAAEKGGMLHDAFDRFKRDPMSKSQFTAEEQEMVDTCMTYLDTKLRPNDAGLLASIACDTELQFCNRTCGGTTDVVVPGQAVIDWKTVQKKRPFKPSEIIQTVAYVQHWQEHAGVEEGHIVQISQSTRKITQVLVLDKDKVASLAPLVSDAFAFHDQILRIKELAGI